MGKLPFSVLFGDDIEMEYKGKKIIKLFRFGEKGRFILKFDFVKSNAENDQALVVFFTDFKGKITVDGKTIKPRGKAFPQLRFWEGNPKKTICFDLIIESGRIAIANRGQSEDSEFYHSLVFGCAMMPEQISENKYRFYCNDHKINDDFDDLIFDLEITKVNNPN